MTDSDYSVEKIMLELGPLLTELYEKNEKKQLLDIRPRQVLQRTFSRIVFLDVITDGGIDRLVAKTILDHPMNEAALQKANQAMVEYNILNKLHPCFKDIEGCSVPHPLLVLSELDTYIMEFIEGYLLSNELKRARYFFPRNQFNELQGHFFQCGRWLHYFQEFTGIHEDSPKALRPVFERAEHRLNLIKRKEDPRCPKELPESVQDFLYNQLNLLKNMPVLVSGRHSDFLPWNILAGAGGITVIDFLGYEEDCVAVDILKMMIGLEDEKSCLTADSWRIKALQKSFLRGFGKMNYVPDQTFILCEVMQRVVSLWSALSNIGISFKQRLENSNRIKRHTEWLLTKNKRSLLSTI